MSESVSRSTRRVFLSTLAVGAAGLTARGAFAEELARTPRMTEGPFYPDRLPLDTDNDLIVVGDSLTPAVGEITHLTGRVLGPTGSPANFRIAGLTTMMYAIARKVVTPPMTSVRSVVPRSAS